MVGIGGKDNCKNKRPPAPGMQVRNAS